ncbi:hypothetical protein BN1050_00597 [Metalysinibacillus saudimassiliensis]|uniref:N-acetyltransferase domain-containing protein n=1 Tax=Metalysinibacillus saudimassiliensis TaxID=1461583 RepID=A0A078LZ59_9BACL|nr:hypothetical protein BN1050_00597 [Metalysinibacillus saudimassiliensis]
MNILQEKGRFYIDNDGKTVAEITYTTPNNDMFIIDHTFVDESLRGQNVGEQLVASVVALARQQERKIIPLCPFAKREFEKKASYADVWKK